MSQQLYVLPAGINVNLVIPAGLIPSLAEAINLPVDLKAIRTYQALQGIVKSELTKISDSEASSVEGSNVAFRVGPNGTLKKTFDTFNNYLMDKGFGGKAGDNISIEAAFLG